MNKIELVEAKGFVIPMPVTVIGTLVNKKPNYMAEGWVVNANNKPRILSISINRNHKTYEAIEQNKSFSINIPSRELMEKTDYCGLVSGEKTEKSQLFTAFYGKLKTAPLIEECPVNFECKVYDIIELPTNQLVLGEVVSVFADKDCLTDGLPDISRINPLLLTMPDNNYWAECKKVGKAWKEGEKLKKGI
ncbi:MAG: flavin reductase family protein [Vulcanimicrobiota bacterium]